MSDLATTTGAPDLEPLLYHNALRDFLKREEAEVWRWYASNKVRDQQAEATRFELLKSTYRVERESQPGLYASGRRGGPELGLDIPITLYQAQNPQVLNASLALCAGRSPYRLQGPVSAKLADVEFRTLLAHELCHFLLCESWDGEYMIAGTDSWPH